MGGSLQIDRTIVEAARRGDADAFETLVRETHRSVYGLVYRIVGNHDDAADVAQDVYVRVWRSLRAFRGDAAFETWVYRVATNAALSHLKRRGRAGEPLGPGELAALERPVDSSGEQLTAEEVDRALRRLPAAQRAVVVLKDVYGFSMQEIAQQVGTTEGAVKVRLFRARRRLAEELYRGGVIVPMKRKRATS